MIRAASRWIPPTCSRTCCAHACSRRSILGSHVMTQALSPMTAAWASTSRAPSRRCARCAPASLGCSCALIKSFSRFDSVVTRGITCARSSGIGSQNCCRCWGAGCEKARGAQRTHREHDELQVEVDRLRGEVAILRRALRQMSCNTCSLSRYGVSKHSPGHEHNTVSDTSRSDSHHTETASTETAAQARRLAGAGGPTNCGYHRHTEHLRYLATFRDSECLDVALQQDLQRSVSGAND